MTILLNNLINQSQINKLNLNWMSHYIKNNCMMLYDCLIALTLFTSIITFMLFSSESMTEK